jgi:2-methylcitrate dehydratase PrpD
MTRLGDFSGELIELEPLGSERERLALHLADTAGAFRIALTTAEGRALLRLARAGGEDPLALARGIAGAIRLTEIDDINLPGCITASAAIVPAALAAAESAGSPPEGFAAALLQGYEAMVRLGIALGGAKALGSVWPSLFAAPFGAAAAASRAFGLDSERTAHALALALAMSQGRPGQPGGKLPGRWFLFGDAVGRGLRVAAAARAGISGDLALLDGEWLRSASGIAEVDLLWFDRGERAPAAMNLSIKPFCTARQAANAVVCFRDLLPEIGDVRQISAILVEVPPIHAAMITRPVQPGHRLATISNVAQQIAIAAHEPGLLWEAERAGPISPERQALAGKVQVAASAELEAHLPREWPARVTVTMGEHRITRLCASIPGDPTAPLDRAAIAAKYAHNPHWDADGAKLLIAGTAALSDAGARAALWRALTEKIETLGEA